jgi:hypothetical protein
LLGTAIFQKNENKAQQSRDCIRVVVVVCGFRGSYIYMRGLFCTIVAFFCSTCGVDSFMGVQSGVRMGLGVQGRSVAMAGEKWPGDRPPVPVAQFLTQFMDASWGRGKFRTEVWEDDVNPADNWWEVYAPSVEEQEAANAGFSFADVESWCKDKGLDFDKAMATYKAEVDKTTEAALKAKETPSFTFNAQDFVTKQDEFIALQKEAFKVAFRLTDDRLQVAKGQPVLDDEDTGVQYKNDPVV